MLSSAFPVLPITTQHLYQYMSETLHNWFYAKASPIIQTMHKEAHWDKNIQEQFWLIVFDLVDFTTICVGIIVADSFSQIRVGASPSYRHMKQLENHWQTNEKNKATRDRRPHKNKARRLARSQEAPLPPPPTFFLQILDSPSRKLYEISSSQIA